MSKETRPRLGLMTEMVVCDICTLDVRLSVIDVPGGRGWQYSPKHGYDICPDCHADLLNVGLEEIQKVLQRSTLTTKKGESIMTADPHKSNLAYLKREFETPTDKCIVCGKWTTTC